MVTQTLAHLMLRLSPVAVDRLAAHANGVDNSRQLADITLLADCHSQYMLVVRA